MIKVYEYKNCSTCRKAITFLESEGIEYQRIPIRETPPTQKELTVMFKSVDAPRKVFNVAGGDYRELKLKDSLPTMTEKQMVTLLAKNGNLVKRPFVIGPGVALVGFKEDLWRTALGC